jgi:hypothetical protein
MERPFEKRTENDAGGQTSESPEKKNNHAEIKKVRRTAGHD